MDVAVFGNCLPTWPVLLVRATQKLLSAPCFLPVSNMVLLCFGGGAQIEPTVARHPLRG